MININMINIKKIKRKKTVIVLVVVVVLIVFYYFLKNGKEEQIIYEIIRGDIVKEIFENGTLKKGEEMVLGFKTGGKVGDIYVLRGEEVLKGDILGKLENEDLKLQLERVNKNLEIAKTTLLKMERGFTEEEINIYKTARISAENSLSNSLIAFENAKADLVSQIKDSYSKTDDAIGNKIDKFFSNPKNNEANFEVSIKDGTTLYSFPILSGMKIEINIGKIEMEERLKLLKEISEKEDSINYIGEVRNYLQETVSFLDKVASAMNSFSIENYTYQSTLSQYKTDVSTARSSASLALSTLNSSVTAFNSAKNSYDLSKNNLKQANSQLNIALDGARDEDIDIQKSVVEGIEAEVKIISRQIEDSIIKAPKDGIVVDIKKKKGEVIQYGEFLFSFIGKDTFQIEADIYEGEITKIEAGDKAMVELIAFPGERFDGEIVLIESSGRIIDGVVYYRIWIDIDNLPERAMSNMTADIIISTIEKEGVLIVSESALERRENKVFVNVLNKKRKAEEREVKIGVRGEGRTVEIIYGLEEGEKVLLK